MDVLKALERKLDEHAKRLPVLALPQRSVLVGVHQFITSMSMGGIGSGARPEPEKALALINRLSYVVPLLELGPEGPIGLDAADALSPFGQNVALVTELLFLAQYGHFSELMPEVHRGYYEVDGNVQSGFVLRHPSPEFSAYEERDILYAEISTPFFRAPPFDRSNEFLRFARKLIDRSENARIDLVQLLRMVKDHYEHFGHNTYEAPALSDKGFRAALGVGRDEFNRFRAAWVAWAEVCRGVARALLRVGQKSGRLQDEAFNAEFIEWLSVGFKTTFIEGTTMGLCGLPAVKFDACMNVFLVGGVTGKEKNYGEGFLPPLRRLGGTTIFCPDVLRVMMSARNIPYAINRVDRGRFDRLVSQELEPQLLSDGEAILKRDASLVVRRNHVWQFGELDLLVYSSKENAALHIQAKAAIPPQGARMVQGIEGRTAEGLEQLKRFRELSGRDRDAVLSAALGTRAQDVEVFDVLLSRSCFGTHRVWQQLAATTACNLQLLAGAVRTLIAQDGRVSVKRFPAVVTDLVERIRATVSRGWRVGTLDLELTRITVPLLDLDYESLGRVRGQLFPSEAT